MAKFSQGKWYVDTAGVLRCDDEYDRSIAYLISQRSTRDLDKANARLMTAAPEMYEILRGLYEFKLELSPDTRKRIGELLKVIDGEEDNNHV